MRALLAGVKRRRTEEEQPDKAPLPLRRVVHYPSHLPFPFALSSQFPSSDVYRSRANEAKTAIHWGQRKLLLSELQLLVFFVDGVSTPHHIVYAGAAPGTHLAFLDQLFGGIHKWELVDPGCFDRTALGHLPNFNLRNEFFTNQTAYDLSTRRLQESGLPALAEIHACLTAEAKPKASSAKLQEALRLDIGNIDVARGTHEIPSMYEVPLRLPHGLQTLLHAALSSRATPLLFISDIRSGSLAHDNFEDHVAENMRAQQCWTELLQPDFAMLKFRLPYTAIGRTSLSVTPTTSSWLQPADDGAVEYLRGDVVLPIWTRPTSTEGRLVVPRGASRRRYKVSEYENQFYFFNAVLRECVHFNHILAPHHTLDNHFDAAAEISTLTKFAVLKYKGIAGEALRAAVDGLVTSLTTTIGGSFEGAVAQRDKIILHLAKGEHLAVAENSHSVESEECAAEFRNHLRENTPGFVNWELDAYRLMQAAKRERRRMIWMRNIDEARWNHSSGTWVFTDMPQVD